MTLDVYRGRKTTIQPTNQPLSKSKIPKPRCIMMDAGFSLTLVKLSYFYSILKPLGLCKYLACIYVLKIMEIKKWEGGEWEG